MGVHVLHVVEERLAHQQDHDVERGRCSTCCRARAPASLTECASWLSFAAISDPSDPMNALVEALRENVVGACSCCAEASIRDLPVQGPTVLSL